MWKKVTLLILLIALMYALYVFAALTFPRQLNQGRVIFLAVAFLLAAVLIWAARRVRLIAWLIAGMLALAGLFLTTSLYPVGQPAWMPMWVYYAWNLLPTALPALALILAAALFYSALRRTSRAPEAGPAGGRTWPALLLGVFLIVKALHNLYWVTVWDDTTDSIGYFWIILPFLAALFCGLLLSVFLTKRARIAGLLYLLLAPTLVYAVSSQAQKVDYRQLTEQRAARVDDAIRAYYASQGRYPPGLKALAPRYLLSVPGPVIIIGQDWCYQGDQDAYQFGYVTHESWMSQQVSGQLVNTGGDASTFGPICAAEIQAIEAGGQ